MRENHVVAALASGVTRRQKYREFAETVRPHILEALAAGNKTGMDIARYLNRHRVRSHTGKLWSESSIRYLRQILEGAQ